MRYCLLILCIFTLASCDLFSTRNPESPDLGNTYIWTPAATPSTLIDNFTGTLQSVDASNYARCFLSATDTIAGAMALLYSYTPRAGLDASSKTIFDSWTVQSEQTFLTKLRASLVANPKLTVTITNIVIDQTNASTAKVTATYQLLLPLPSSSTLPSTLSGTLLFQLVLVATETGTKEWRISSWSDFALATGTAKTFSDLKVQLAS
jgi:hypothetical protein